MASTFYLEILSPEHPFFAGKAETLVFPSLDGLYGILPRHEPMVAAVMAGELKFVVDGVWHYAAVGEGFVEILPDHVVLLADFAELPEEIDVKRAAEAKARAEERMRQHNSKLEYHYTQAAMSRALARLKVSKHG